MTPPEPNADKREVMEPLGGSTDLPQTSEAPIAVAPTFRACLLTIGGQPYAVDLRHVREVIPVECITPVPGMPALVLGVTNVRGSVVPVVDLLLMLGLPAAESLPLFVVVLRQEDYLIGALVDRSPEIMSVMPEQLMGQTRATGETGKLTFISDAVRLEKGICPVLDVPSLVDCVESESTAAGIE
jgi:purine-binding chemotaxis protein CheW